MTRVLLTASLLLGSVSGAFAQEAPKYFQLQLPDFFETAFDGGASVIDLPGRPIRRLSILVFNAVERDISSSGIRVWVNGKGMGNILDSKGVDKGLLLTMDPSTLNKRPDQLFDATENTIEILASDKRGRKYYQSWILRAGAGQNEYFAYSATVSPDDPSGIPPDLVIDEPRVPPVLQPGQTSARIELKLTCSSAHPVTALELNGKPLASIPGAVAPFAQTIEIRRDTKELVLDATDQQKNRRRVVIPVIALQNATPKPRFAGNKYALVIGISRYGDAKDAPPPLAAAAANADEFARQLRESAGFRKENVRVLLDDQATLPQIRTGLYDFASKAAANDLLIVYVAAHALQDPRSGRNDKMYLAPYGAQLSQIDSTALNFDDLDMLLNRSVRSNHTFLIFDAGHQVEGVWKFPGRSLVNNHLLNLFNDQEGRAVMVSASAGEVSGTGTTGQELFTAWMLRALAGDADINHDGVVTAEEMFRFVAEKVREESKGAQNPRYRLPAKSADMPVAENAAGHR